MRKIINSCKLILLLFIGINQRKILKWMNKTSLSFIQLFLPSAISLSELLLILHTFYSFSNFRKNICNVKQFWIKLPLCFKIICHVHQHRIYLEETLESCYLNKKVRGQTRYKRSQIDVQ